MKLNVSAEMKGKQVPVGVIEGNDSNDARFRYLSSFLDHPESCSLSLSLPLREEPFSSEETAAFFEGLLPEGFTRRTVAEWMHAEESDYLTILHGLGRECLGAVCITEDGENLDASYEAFTPREIERLAEEGAVKSAEIVTKSHLSLAGASGKVGLYYANAEKAWYAPRGTAPSTHIVKQSHIRLDSIITNEQLALMTAERCGISVPHSFIIDASENNKLFATERYDRITPRHPDMISGLPRPLRLHQEDFAQAMGIPSSRKYEHDSSGYMKKMFDVLRRFSSDTITDQLRLWDIIVFDYLIGNTDAHIKNFSLLYGSNWKSIRLAPAYDIISTVVYKESTREMAFSIGGSFSIDEIDESSFRIAAKEVGMGERMAMRRFENLRNQFLTALTEAAEILASQGDAAAIPLKDRILECRGVF